MLAPAVLATSIAAAGTSATYASPTGSGTVCSAAQPCEIETAIEQADPGANVRLLGGRYEIAANIPLVIDAGKQVLAADRDDPVLITEPESGQGVGTVYVTGEDSSLADVSIQTSEQAAVVLGNSTTGRVERVHAESSAADANACAALAGSISDSVCVASADSASAYALTARSSAEFGEIDFRNVTAVSNGGSGLLIEAGAPMTLTARNSIFQGDEDSQRPDIVTSGVQGDIYGDIDYSNYSSVRGDSGPASVPPPGFAGNQTAAPLFADPTAGDFHQADGSPTIDSGDPMAAGVGVLDLDGSDRTQGQAVDIGAYEAPSPDVTKPAVRITKAPARQTKQRTATFRFTGTDDSALGPLGFSCSLDGKPERACGSPKTYRSLKAGRHAFAVTASDVAGNESTKRYVWKVVRRG